MVSSRPSLLRHGRTRPDCARMTGIIARISFGVAGASLVHAQVQNPEQRPAGNDAMEIRQVHRIGELHQAGRAEPIGLVHAVGAVEDAAAADARVAEPGITASSRANRPRAYTWRCVRGEDNPCRRPACRASPFAAAPS